MARIRSIHPGLFTDEAFMTASAHARLLIIGIWCEAWDDGVFEWKPLTLKARLFPADMVSVADLLSELAALEFVQQFEADGKKFGIIRNFQKYQRPKKPNSSGKLPPNLSEYAGSSHRGSEPVPNQSDTGGGKSPQMEDVGCREGEEGNEDTASAASSQPRAPDLDLADAERRCGEACGSDRLGSFAPIAELLHRQADLERDILPVMRSRPASGGKVSSWKFYVPIIAEAMLKRSPVPTSQGPPKVFIVKGSAEWLERVASGHKPGMTTQDPKTKAEGWYFPAPTTPESKDKAAA